MLDVSLNACNWAGNLYAEEGFSRLWEQYAAYEIFLKSFSSFFNVPNGSNSRLCDMSDLAFVVVNKHAIVWIYKKQTAIAMFQHWITQIKCD